MDTKTELIKKITDRHPAEGVELGLSWYKGGMADTGDWHFRKLLEMSEKELETAWKKLTKKDIPEAPLSREEISDWDKYIKIGNKHVMNLRAYKALGKIAQDIEHKILWGNDKNI